MSLSEKRSRYWLLAASSLAGYLLLPFIFPLLGQYNRAPLRDIRFFAPTPAGGLAYAALFLLLYGAYWAAWRAIREHGASLKKILAPLLLFCIPLLFVYPINATDIFRYFIRGRVTAVYGASALTTPPSAFPQDPYLPLAGEWAGETSPYGPLWELLAAAVTELSGQSLLPGLLLFKLIAILAHIAIAVAIWRAYASSPPPLRAANTLLWAWNPALLAMFAIDGHNDALMLFWLVAGYLLMRHRPLPGLLVAFLAVLTKPIALLALPFFFIGHWRRQPGWPGRWRFLLLAAAGALILAFVAFAPLGSPFDLAMRLLTEASGAAGFSPGILFVLLGQRFIPAFDVQLALETGATLSLLLLAAITLLLLWRVWRGFAVARAVAAEFTAYTFTAMTFRIWYSVWPFAWVILDEDQRHWAHAFGFWFSLTAHLSLVIYGYLRVALFSGDQLVAHLVGVPFTFLLPLFLARRFPLHSRTEPATGVI